MTKVPSLNKPILLDKSADETRNERFLDTLVEELQTMSDGDALEGENAESLVKLGHALLTRTREEASAEGRRDE